MYNDLLAFAKTLHYCHEDAEDNVGMVMQRFMEKEGEYKKEDLKRLLFTSVKNNFINTYRMKQRRVMLEFREDILIEKHGPDRADINVVLKDILDAMLELRPELRDVIQMRADGYKYDEISVKTGVVMGTAKARLFKARTILKKKLDINDKKKSDL